METGHSIKMYYITTTEIFRIFAANRSTRDADYVILNFLARSVCLMSSFNRSV